MTLRPPLTGLGTSAIQLLAGSAYTLPLGKWNVNTGRFSTLEVYDPVTTAWLPWIGAVDADCVQIYSDGQSYRIANNTGCPVSAIVSNGGSGYVSAPTVTVSEGKSKWVAVLGHTVSSITVVNGGSGFNYPPEIVIGAPPPPGYPATATAAISNGSISAITMINVGAGYTLPPFVSVIPDPRDTTAPTTQPVLTPVLANGGKVTAVICTDPFGGAGITSGTVPTLTFSGGGGSSAAATVVMDWVVASITIANGGAGYAASGGMMTFGTGIPTVANAYTNPRYEGGLSLLRMRPAQAYYTSTANAISSISITDNGMIGGVTSNIVLEVFGNGTASPTTLATLTLVPGGVNDAVYITAAP